MSLFCLVVCTHTFCVSNCVTTVHTQVCSNTNTPGTSRQTHRYATLMCTESPSIWAAIVSLLDVAMRAFAHLCFMACVSLRTSCTCVLWHLRLCERGAPSTWYVGGRPRSADTKFPFLSQQREWNRGKSVSKAGRGWVGKRPSLGCPGWLRFPAKVRCPRHSPRGPGRDAWP